MDYPESMGVSEVAASRPKAVSDYLDSIQNDPNLILSVVQETDLYGKSFNDGLTGIFAVHPLLVRIIDTPQFQRLRSLRMLGMAYLVYPSATHTRFEHCIGVSHLAGKLVATLVERQPELDVSRADHLCVQIAGLLHDLGHGPFSHTFERFMKIANPDAHWEHEKASEEMIDHLLDTNQLRPVFQQYGLQKQDVEFIKELIAGQPKDGWDHAARPKSKRWLYDIVANKRTGVDVDKFDYLARDAKATAMATKFDCQRCIMFSRVIRTADGAPQICFQDKEVDNVYDMFNIRFSMHKRVYQHRVTRVLEKMLLDGLVKANRYLKFRGLNNKLYSLSEAHKDMVAFQRLKDKILDDILDQDDRPELAEAQEILGRILTRKHYHFLRQTDPQEQTPTTSEEEVLTEIISAFGRVITTSLTVEKLRENLVVVMRCYNYGMGTTNPLDTVGFYNKENRNIITYIPRSEVSPVLPMKFQECIQSFYYRSLDSTIDIDEAGKVIDAWAQLKSIKIGTATVKFTPTKRKRESTETDDGISSPATNGSASHARRRLF